MLHRWIEAAFDTPCILERGVAEGLEDRKLRGCRALSSDHAANRCPKKPLPSGVAPARLADGMCAVPHSVTA
jgi:hypothetical protein